MEKEQNQNKKDNQIEEKENIETLAKDKPEQSTNNNENTFSETKNVVKKEMLCKDGFCALPNQKEISKKRGNDMNLFDPI